MNCIFYLFYLKIIKNRKSIFLFQQTICESFLNRRMKKYICRNYWRRLHGRIAGRGKTKNLDATYALDVYWTLLKRFSNIESSDAKSTVQIAIATTVNWKNLLDISCPLATQRTSILQEPKCINRIKHWYIQYLKNKFWNELT